MTDPNPSQLPLDNSNNNNNHDIFIDQEAEAAAMAAAMGFSSFGQQAPTHDSDPDDNSAAAGDRPSKKRRYNSRVDAYVGPAPQGTGANDVPVQRRVFNNAPKEEIEVKDKNEINIDDDDDNDQGASVEASMTTTTTLPINTSLPPKPPIQAPTQRPVGFNSHSQRGDHGARGGRGGGRGGRGNHGGASTHGRDPTKPWYADYYDPSSNENPWERLEQAREIEAVGVWLPSRSGGGRGARGGFGVGDRGFGGSGSGSDQQGAQEVAQQVA
ncbi:hypothetical protein QBC32DRAFT_332362 [Pseudoneurospora amorphoporcata]|uniref:Uncharacterized protein n=1 Tax=Pseudoneurospora amorphoporcata TaxID=241081 RepID=A0AAN6SIS2_9PEZI|nr:hypothetical protein QBC32DRAFT_332362 [Pseudoneurospora amorphoporcata]